MLIRERLHPITQGNLFQRLLYLLGSLALYFFRPTLTSLLKPTVVYPLPYLTSHLYSAQFNILGDSYFDTALLVYIEDPFTKSPFLFLFFFITLSTLPPTLLPPFSIPFLPPFLPPTLPSTLLSFFPPFFPSLPPRPPLPPLCYLLLSITIYYYRLLFITIYYHLLPSNNYMKWPSKGW